MSMNEIKEKAGEILRQYKILHKDEGKLYMVYSSSGDVKYTYLDARVWTQR